MGSSAATCAPAPDISRLTTTVGLDSRKTQDSSLELGALAARHENSKKLDRYGARSWCGGSWKNTLPYHPRVRVKTLLARLSEYSTSSVSAVVRRGLSCFWLCRMLRDGVRSSLAMIFRRRAIASCCRDCSLPVLESLRRADDKGERKLRGGVDELEAWR